MISRKLLIILSITIFSSFAILTSEIHAQESEVSDEAIESVEEELIEDSEITSSSIWDLVGQAGGIRYPIYGILIVGIFLISLRTYELYMDSQKQTELQNTSFRHMSLNEITSKVAAQQDYLLSRIMAKLINVFETNRNADHLHDEITNYNSIQQDNFSSFKNRVNFLSDTAGALGLLGTVWGMFVVFSSGTLERDVILYGMGIALMSTLLGLVVSIILDFCSTLTDGYFSKHLEQVTSKADELRFRLIELSENASTIDAPASLAPAKSKAPVLSKNNTEKKTSVTESEQETIEPQEVNEPSQILIKSKIKEVKAGQTIDNIEVQLIGSTDDPISSEKLEVILDGNGKINGTSKKAIVKTDSKGIALFSWKVDERSGKKQALVRCSDDKYKNIKKVITIDAKALEPETLKLLNNHQAGQTGSQLQKPITIYAIDKYENPVSDEKVLMKVTMGNGKLNDGSKEITTKTDKNGKAFVDFTLGSEPGFNAVDIILSDHDITKSFQAVGQEVTV